MIDDNYCMDLKNLKSVQELIDLVSLAPENRFRGCMLPQPEQNPNDLSLEGTKKNYLFAHQQETINAIGDLQPESGIIHLPTGSGKTRVAIELMANRLNENPNCRIIWASYPNTLIRQAMTRVFEQYHLFKPRPNTIWMNKSVSRFPELIFKNQIVFATRQDLTNLIKDYNNGSVKRNPIKYFLNKRLQRKQILLVYDECHQLSALELQKALRKFYFKKDKRFREKFQVVGLSATPLPTETAKHKLLQDSVFPIYSADNPGVDPSWKMMVYHRVNNKELADKKILCRINTHLDKRGIFDIPKEMLASASKPLSKYKNKNEPVKKDLVDFERLFNQKVVNDEILDYLGGKIGDNFEHIGKTIIFVTRKTHAHYLASVLYNHPKVGKRKVTLVHSGLEALDTDGELGEAGSTENQIEEFKRKGHEPAIIINIGMLTTGFDDPAIKTVILARQTFSCNLFWQMIGRGTRGPACGGTSDCNVIDPFKLKQIFPIYAGYKPSIYEPEGYSDKATIYDDIGDNSKAIAPQIPLVDVAPVSSDKIEIDPHIRKTVISILKSFLNGDDLSDEALFNLSIATRVETNIDGSQVIKHIEDSEVDGSYDNLWICRKLIKEAEKELGSTLNWLESQLPNELNPRKITLFRRKIDFVKRKKILTEEAFEEALGMMML